MPNPSPEWTKDERDEVVSALRGQFEEYTTRYGSPIPLFVEKDIQARIDLVEHEGAAFLEENRANILESLEDVVARFREARK